MVVAWPTDLPLKIRYGTEFEYGLEGSKAVTEFENGPILSRRRFTNTPYRMSAVLKFTDAQYERFLSFYTSTIFNGTASFIAPVLVVNTIKNMRCQIIDKSVKPLAEDYNRWSLNLTFEIRGEYGISEGTYYLIDLWGSEFLEEFCDRIQVIVNEDYPSVTQDW